MANVITIVLLSTSSNGSVDAWYNTKLCQVDRHCRKLVDVVVAPKQGRKFVVSDFFDKGDNSFVADMVLVA